MKFKNTILHFVYFNPIYFFVSVLIYDFIFASASFDRLLFEGGNLLGNMHLIGPYIMFFTLRFYSKKTGPVSLSPKITFDLVVLFTVNILLVFAGYYFLRMQEYLLVLSVLGFFLFLWNNHHFLKQNLGLIGLGSIPENLFLKKYFYAFNLVLIPLVMSLKFNRFPPLAFQAALMQKVELCIALLATLLFTLFAYALFKKLRSPFDKKIPFFVALTYLQLMVLLFLPYKYGAVIYIHSHWLVEVLLLLRFLSADEDQIIQPTRYLLFSVLLILLSSFIYFNRITMDAGQIFFQTPENITFAGNGFPLNLQLFFMSFGTFLISSHFYLSRHLYSNKSLRLSLLN